MEIKIGERKDHHRLFLLGGKDDDEGNNKKININDNLVNYMRTPQKGEK